MSASSKVLGRRLGLAALGGLLAAVALLALFLGLTGYSNNQASAATDGAAMSLEINGQTGTVNLVSGSTFDVVANADAIPLPNGYSAAVVWLEFGTELVLKSSAITWPDCEEATAVFGSNPSYAYWACLTGIIGGPPSFHKGPLYSFTFTCSAGASTTLLELVPFGVSPAGNNGSLYQEAGPGTFIVPSVSGMTVNCIDVLPGQDSDGDGCTDLQELGPDETLGGQRDPQNPWDFYDVAGLGPEPPDGLIDLFNDIVKVLNHYAPTGLEPEYDVWYDRGPSAGPNQWNMTAPDGMIDLFNDIVGVISQAFHDCR